VSTLLLADDSLTIRRVIELTFADAGIDVVTVADGREAIARIQQSPPDIVLADVGMPERDGYDVAAFVKRAPALAHIPVLLLAGALEPVDEARAREVGADGVLVKPFEPHVAVSRVRELLARASRTRVTPPSVPDASPAPSGGDYLDRLDAAFAAMSASPRPIGQPTTSLEDFPTESASPPVPSLRSIAPASPPPPTTSSGVSLSDAFVALLAAEQGRSLPNGPVLPAPVITDAQIDEIARRVATRLGDEPLRQAVLDAAERLVREEIDRIKGVQRGS